MNWKCALLTWYGCEAEPPCGGSSSSFFSMFQCQSIKRDIGSASGSLSSSLILTMYGHTWVSHIPASKARALPVPGPSELYRLNMISLSRLYPIANMKFGTVTTRGSIGEPNGEYTAVSAPRTSLLPCISLQNHAVTSGSSGNALAEYAQRK